MSKRKFGFEGFSLNRQPTYKFEQSQPHQRLYQPSHDHHEDHDLDDIAYDDEKPNPNSADDEIDPLDAFMEGIQEEIRAPPPPSNPSKERIFEEDGEEDPMESFLRLKKDLGLALASDALRAGYDSDEEVYAAAKAVDAGMVSGMPAAPPSPE